MVMIGRINNLTVIKMREYGAHLDGGEDGDVILPIKSVPAKCQPGDEVEVFVYVDREDRLRATTRKPKAVAGQFAKFPVVARSSGGAYLDWGMQKDLFVPKSEQLVKMEEGRSYVVFITLDEKTDRIVASSKLDKYLSQQPPEYSEGEEVDLIIYDRTDLGYKALINQTHGGMLYRNEVFRKLEIGQELKGYIKKIREDFKIDLSLQQAGYKAVDDTTKTILETIKDHGGRIAVTDKSPPEEIYALFGVSKKVFKKAIGGLYKRRLISIDPKGIKLVK
jgi:predicted RNA-binding protein (virulence factor B family)